MKFLVIGAGNAGHAATAYFLSKGEDCKIYTRSPEKATILNKNGITATGQIEGTFPVTAVTNLSEAVKGVDIILVMTWANHHQEVCEALRPVLENGQSIILFGGNWGALKFGRILGEDIVQKNLTIIEVATQLFLSLSTETGKVIFNVKEQVLTSAYDPNQTVPFLKSVARILPQLVPAVNIYETSLTSGNPIVHTPIMLLNATRIENGESWRFYGEGLSQGACSMICALDNERIAVAKALGVDALDILTATNIAWEDKHDNLFDALNLNSAYHRLRGPNSFNKHKFLDEDIPFGLAPLCKIGRIFKVPTPTADLLVKAFSILLGRDLMEEGTTFTKEDFNIL